MTGFYIKENSGLKWITVIHIIVNKFFPVSAPFEQECEYFNDKK